MSAPVQVSASSFMFVTATDVASTDADVVGGLKDVSITVDTPQIDTTYIGDPNATGIPGVTTISISASGQYLPDDAGQKRLQAAHAAKSKTWITVRSNPSADDTQVKETRYPCYVSAFTPGVAQGDVVTVSIEAYLARGSITEIMGEEE